MNKIIDGKKLSLVIKNELLNMISEMDSKPQLAVIQVGNNEASNVYIKHKESLALELGIEFLYFKFDELVTMNELIIKIEELNVNEKVDSIFIQLPLPKHLDSNLLINKIDTIKDVDGLTNKNIALLANNQDGIIPCTPKGIMKIIDYYNIDLIGKYVVIIGRSNLVGKPLLNLLLNKNVTVTICHSYTKNLSIYTKKADVLIVAVGQKYIIKKEMIKKGAVIIDVGINKVNNKLHGDVDYENVLDKVSLITPVPGGVGPMTVVMLMQNVVDAHLKRITNK